MKLVLFNQDLRINDNPALYEAVKQSNLDGKDIVAIYIFDKINNRLRGGASKWFLYNILSELQQNLQQKIGCNLSFFAGDSLQIIGKIINNLNINEIYFNNDFTPDGQKLNDKIINFATSNNIKIFSFDGNLLFKTGAILNGSGQYFKVFTPFWKKCLENEENIKKPLPAISLIKKNSLTIDSEIKLSELNLLSKISWHHKMQDLWQFKEEDILSNFAQFIANKIINYKNSRDFPGMESTSKLSPYLHFGVISVRYIFNEVRLYQKINNQLQNKDINHFLSEIGWREFSYNLLYNFPQLPSQNFNSKFDKFSWHKDDEILQKWQKGLTGYPIVDAGMRELWKTGWMHNRVRMIVGSFLVKDLLIDWRVGEEWFWDCLVDADMASNTASWQWIAGSGADAAPYFRIFNPTLQSKKFDPDGVYIRKWLPEISKLPNNLIHEPSKANIFELKDAEIDLGKDYPYPIVDHKKARDMAMMIYKTL